MVMMERPVFVPNGESRQDTAVLLTGTAEEFGISQRSILTTPTGFFITDELADIIYDEVAEDEGEAEVKAEPKTKKKTSGNRAAKNTGTDKE